MVIEIPKFWTISFTNLAKNTTKFPAAFGGQRFALEIGPKTLLKKEYMLVEFSKLSKFSKKGIYAGRNIWWLTPVIAQHPRRPCIRR